MNAAGMGAPHSDFLQSRIDYLKNLPGIGQGWIGGGGVIEGQPPSEVICATGIEFLKAFEGIEPLNATTLVLGPLVRGGIQMEWKSASQGLLFSVTLDNAGHAEFEINSTWDAREHVCGMENALVEWVAFAEIPEPAKANA